MKWKNKYLIAVALLAVLVVVFGLAGTVMPVSELPLSSSSSDSVTHFMNPPTYNSSWLDITDKAGQYFNVTHNLNSTDVIVDITGRTTIDGGTHQKHLGGTDYTAGWNRTYGGANTEYAYSVVQTTDGGYALAGHTYSYGAGGYDFWLVKTDSVGNAQWNQTYGGANYDGASSVVQTSDGGYAIAGFTESFGAGSRDAWLVKTDVSGNMLWNKTYGGYSDEVSVSVIQTDDGGYAQVGYTWSFGAGSADIWLVKTYANGTMQWNKTYGGTQYDTPYLVVQTSDGGYAVVGQSVSFGPGDFDFWLIKTDSAGNVQWSKTYGGAARDYATCMVQTGDGGYALVGPTRSFGAGDYDFWLVKVDDSGNMLWNQTYGGTALDHPGWIVQTTDGGYAITGGSSSFGAGSGDFWLVKTYPAGNMEWNQTYGGTNSDWSVSLIQTSDGGYTIAGYTNSFGAGNNDFWLVKTDNAGNARPSFEVGLAWTDSTADNITLYRGTADTYWNYVRVRIWTIEEPTWMFGDINQDGIVDIQDVAIVAQNYGQTFSLLSLTGIIAVAGIHTYKKRKQPK